MALTSYTYEVFLSFRGADTRKNFTDHLYSALTKAEINTFRDDNNIQRGENIESEIEKAIQESKMSVIVLSKDYASSTWCLDELVMIMDRQRTAGHVVLPVFYDVDPSQVGEQTGSYAEAFAEHQDSFQDEMERVETWRATLKKVAYLGGMVLQDRHESQFIEDIVEEVRKKLDSIPLFAPYIAWNKYRPLMKKIQMILGTIYCIGILLFVVWCLYNLIAGWIEHEAMRDCFFKHNHCPYWTEIGFDSAGTKKNIALGIRSMCSLALAFYLSEYFR